MTRSIATIDRVATFVVAVALIAIGSLAIIWRLNLWLSLPAQLSTSPATRIMGMDWWPFAIAALGVILALVGVRWLWAHVSTSGVRMVTLPGSGRSGHLTASVKAAAGAAADALADTPGVRNASGKAVRQRGQLLVELNATVDADAELSEVAESADRVSSELARVLERPDIYCRVRIGVSSRSGGRRLR